MASLAVAELACLLNVDKDELEDILGHGLQAGKHNEFDEIGRLIGLDTASTLDRFSMNVANQHLNEFSELVSIIEQTLKEK